MIDQFLEVLSIACSVAGSSRAVLTCKNPKTGLLSFLPNTAQEWTEVSNDYSHPMISRSNPISLLNQDQFARVFDNHPLRSMMPQIDSLATYYIREDENGRWAMTISNPSEAYFSSDANQGIVERLVALLQSIIGAQHSFEEDTPHAAPILQAGFAESADQSVTDDTALQFLRETLPQKTRVLSRNAVAYVALRTWSKQIKNHQVKALTAVKQGHTRNAAKSIACEMYDAANKVFGASFDKIVPMPPGSSGRQDCLSVAVGDELAKKLNVPAQNVLRTKGAMPGKSHPKKSARLSPFELEQNISGRVLLVDDVASSGKHIELARTALEKSGCSVSSMVWISD